MHDHGRQRGRAGSAVNTSVYDENRFLQGRGQSLIVYKRQPDMGQGEKMNQVKGRREG